MRHKLFILAITLMMVITLAACSGAATNDTNANTTADKDSSGAVLPKNLTVALFWLGSNLDPAVEWNGWTLTRAAIGETLVQFDEQMKLVPKLADSWKRVDETTWEFHIREKVTFHNGNPVTAQAVKSSIERSLTLNERGKAALPVESMTAEGQTLTIKTLKPYASLLGNMAEPLSIIVDTTADTANFVNKPIATGPFMVNAYTPDSEIKVSRYTNYWAGAAAVEGITFRYIEDDHTRALALQSGEIDVSSNIGRSSLSLFEDQTKYTIDEIASLRTQFIWLNQENPLLKDPAVRRAMSYGIDRETYASKLIGGQAAKGPFTSALPFGYDSITAYDYNAAKSKQLLDEAGYTDTNVDGIREKNGSKLAFKLIFNAAYESDTAVAAAIQAQFKDIGIDLSITSYEDLTEKQRSGDFDLCLSSINTGITGDPQYILDFYFKTGAEWNVGKYSNPELDGLIESLNVEFDVEKRYKLAAQAQQMIVNDAGYLFVTYTPTNIVSKSFVKGAAMYPVDFYLLDHRIRVETDK